MDQISRRRFIETVAAVSASTYIAPAFAISTQIEPSKTDVLGHGDHQFRVVKGWGSKAAQSIPVRDCHEMVQSKDGRLFMFGNHTQNNMLIFNKDGKVLDSWGSTYPGGHGCTIHDENGEEFLYLTDPDLHKVVKTDLNGRVLLTLDAPTESEKYESLDRYRPTETAVAPNGDIYVADGYGSQYLLHYAPDGSLKGVYAGPGDGETGQLHTFQNMHGVTLDTRDPAAPTLIVTARQQNGYKRFTLNGEYLYTVELPGAWVCRGVIHEDLLMFAVIISGVTHWNSNGSGFLAILDKRDRVVSCPGGLEPRYSGALSPLAKDLSSDEPSPFVHPHDVCADRDGNLYVPQWASGQTFPIKLERI